MIPGRTTLPTIVDVWELDEILNNDILFGVVVSLIEIIVVGVKINLLLPWIRESKPTYTQLTYELDTVHLEDNEDYEDWKSQVDIF